MNVCSIRALAKSCKEDDLLTRFAKRPRPEVLGVADDLLFKVVDGGSIDDSYKEKIRNDVSNEVYN